MKYRRKVDKGGMQAALFRFKWSARRRISNMASFSTTSRNSLKNSFKKQLQETA
jgi:hypothetical protein